MGEHHDFVITNGLLLTFIFASRNDLLWLHTVFAVLYLAVTPVVLRHHTLKIKGTRKETVSYYIFTYLLHLLHSRLLLSGVRLISLTLQARNTLLVCSVPKTATEQDVKTHFT